jgi:hypothetical protein
VADSLNRAVHKQSMVVLLDAVISSCLGVFSRVEITRLGKSCCTQTMV